MLAGVGIIWLIELSLNSVKDGIENSLKDAKKNVSLTGLHRFLSATGASLQWRWLRLIISRWKLMLRPGWLMVRYCKASIHLKNCLS